MIRSDKDMQHYQARGFLQDITEIRLALSIWLDYSQSGFGAIPPPIAAVQECSKISRGIYREWGAVNMTGCKLHSLTCKKCSNWHHSSKIGLS